MTTPTSMNVDGWFVVRGHPTDQTKPPVEERYSKFGEAFDRAVEIGSAMQFRSVMLSDLNGVAYATFNMLWTVPRELR